MGKPQRFSFPYYNSACTFTILVLVLLIKRIPIKQPIVFILKAFNRQKTIEIILERDSSGKVIKKLDYELKKPYPTIEIRVPKNLAGLQRDIINKKTSDYKQIFINAVSRPYPFYVNGKFDQKTKINLFDIPTTLYASYMTIKEFFKQSFLATDDNEQKLMNKEIKNFEKTLSKLIPDGIESKYYKFTVY